MAGGRYDGLVEALGGSHLPGVGWAAGIERLALLIDRAPTRVRPIALVPVGEQAADVAFKIAHDLRHAGFSVDMGYSGNVGRRMKRASKVNARIAVLIGDDEIATGAATVRNMDTGAQETAPLDRLVTSLEMYRA